MLDSTSHTAANKRVLRRPARPPEAPPCIRILYDLDILRDEAVERFLLAFANAIPLAGIVDSLYFDAAQYGLVGHFGPDQVEATIHTARDQAELRLRMEQEAAAEDDAPELMLPQSSQEALALAFATEHAHDLRYVARWGRWMINRDGCWREDDTLAVYDLVRAHCRDAVHGLEGRVARAIASAATVAAIERLSRADRRLAATVDQWDSDIWLLGTPAGVVDLRTGAMRPLRSNDYVTRTTAVGPGGECPRWHTFLREITNNDEELVAYLQRLCGYALTGSTREQMLAFAQGAGANGKSVFINTIAGVLGDYHRTANMETFTASMHEQHRTHIAYLRGARLVTATETEHGRRWAEARIKEMTGGERLQANYMRQDPFEFVPQFTLLIAGNHRPGLRAVDEAVRRRFHLIPFRVTIPPAERDLELPERLRAEWPGTLAWMIEGCLEWQRRGLDPPRAVVEATSSYLEEEDAVATWIDERCQVHPNYWAASGALYGSWLIWAEAAGVYVLNEKALVQALENRGFTRRRTGGVRGIQGLRIVADP